jgi:hypothetical protein
MLPWASFPKRFPTDVRLVPRNVALDAPRTGAFTRLRARRGHGRAFRPVVPRVHRGVLVRQSPLVSTIVPHCGATSRCASLHDVPFPDAPKRIRSRRPFSKRLPATFPGQIAPPVRPSFWTSTIWPSAAGFNRRSLGAEALRVRTSSQCEKPSDSAIPKAIPRRESHVLSGKPERPRSTRTERFQSRFLRRRPCRRVRTSLRASTPGFAQVPRAHSRVRLWNRAPPSAKHASIGAAPSGAGLLATAGPITRFPRRRNAVVHGFPDWQYEPGRSPVSGQQPWSSVPGMHTLRSYLFLNTGAPRIRRFLETRPLGRSPCSASITFHAEASRDLRLPFGKALEECRTQRVQYSGDCLRRHVETFWFGLSLRATTLGPGHRV